MPLSDITIRSAQPKEKMFRLFDGGNLYLEVYPNGRKLWRVRLYRQGKETMLSLGAYPAVSLKDARAKRDEINVMKAGGIDPVEDRKKSAQGAKAEITTFQSVYDEWLEKRKPPFWRQTHYDKTVIRAEKHILPLLGKKPIAEIDPPAILSLVREIEKKKIYVTAHKVLGICSMVFRYAVASGIIRSDPCRDLRGALTPVSTTNYATVTAPLKVGRLLLDIDAYVGTATVHCALRLSPLVFVRPGELRQAEWSEIDFKAKEWRIPAERMKMKEEHVVPLSTQAMVILEELREMTGNEKYIFPSVRRGTSCMSNNTITAALRRMGYSNDVMTAHGFRAMASTLLNELGYDSDWIERQLAHAERNKVRAAYNRASYLKERRAMMQAWADHLDSLRQKAIEDERERRLR